MSPDPTAVFKETVSEYIRADDQIKDAEKALKDIRKKKAELAEVILDFMRENGIDDVAMGDKGKLVRRESKRTEGLKQEHIVAELRVVLGEEKAEQVFNSISAKRDTVVTESLSRRKTGKNTAVV